MVIATTKKQEEQEVRKSDKSNQMDINQIKSEMSSRKLPMRQKKMEFMSKGFDIDEFGNKIGEYDVPTTVFSRDEEEMDDIDIDWNEEDKLDNPDEDYIGKPMRKSQARYLHKISDQHSTKRTSSDHSDPEFQEIRESRRSKYQKRDSGDSTQSRYTTKKRQEDAKHVCKPLL